MKKRKHPRSVEIVLCVLASVSNALPAAIPTPSPPGTVIGAPGTAAPSLTSLAISPSTANLRIGESVNFTALGKFSDQSLKTLSNGVGGWANQAPMPTRRWDMTVGTVAGAIIVAGGYSVGHLTVVEAYGADGKWSRKSDRSFHQSYAAYAVMDGALYAAGGTDCCVAIANLTRYDPAKDAWTFLRPMSAPRSAQAGDIIGGTFYVAGGVNPSGRRATLEAYNPPTDTWSLRAPMTVARASVAASAANGWLYVMGGNDANANPLSSVEAYDPPSDNWKTVAAMPTARSYHTAVSLNGIIYAIGGAGPLDAKLGAVEAYDPLLNAWTVLAPLRTPRASLKSAVFNGQIFVIGGRVGSPDVASDVVESFAPPEVMWFSSNPSVARINANGTLTAIAPGIATVTAVNGLSLRSSINVTVTSGPPPRGPALTISKSGSDLLVDYLLSGSKGVFSILFYPAIGDFAARTISLFDGDLALTHNGRLTFSGIGTNFGAGFFRLIEDSNASLDDYDSDSERPQPPVSSAMFFAATLPNPTPINTAFELRIQTVNELGELMPRTGSVRFSLIRENGDAVTTAHTISPATVPLVNGNSVATVTISSTASLGDFFLAGEFSTAVAAVRPPQPLASLSLRAEAPRKQKLSSGAPIGEGWIAPVAGGAPVTGTFGEWPGHSSSHLGIDLAAATGTTIVAAKSGKVIVNSALSSPPNQVPDVGGMLSLQHDDGVITRYLHIAPVATLTNETLVKQGAPIGLVGNYTDRRIPVHLHFEIRRNGNAVNPSDLIPALVTGDAATPTLGALYLRKGHPALIEVRNKERPFDSAMPGETFVVFQTFDQDSRDRIALLAPRKVVFATEPIPQVIDFSDESSLKKFLTFYDPGLAGSPRRVDVHSLFNPGYTVLTSDELLAKNRRSQIYQFWFRWDTTPYRSTPSGPRAFRIQSIDAAGHDVSQNFEFGPQIVNKAQLGTVTTSFDVQVIARMGPVPQKNVAAQTLDTIVLALDSSGLTRGSANIDGTSSWSVTGFNEPARGFRVAVSDNAEGILKVRARSTTLPDLADEVQITLRSSPLPPPLPAISISDVSVSEGNTGLTRAVFNANLSKPSLLPVTVEFRTINGNAVAGSDFVFASATLTFAPGTTNQTIAIDVIGDMAIELDELFFVELRNPVNATLPKDRATGTIRNDDQPLPVLSIEDASVKEGDAGLANLQFRVSLSAASPANVTVDYTTIDASASSATDFVATKGRLTIPAATLSQTIVVPVLGETAIESDETLRLVLSNAVNATLGRSEAIGTILNDDSPPFVITTTSLPAASNQGLQPAYLARVLATGAIAPVTWTATGLPPGFTLVPLQSGGVTAGDEVDIAGFPGNGQPPARDYSITVTGVDKLGRTATKVLTLTINGGTTSFTLTVTKAGTGAGSVNPAGGSFTNGALVTLTASADAGSIFAGWSGGCSGTGPCSIKMDANKSVTATFTKLSGTTAQWSGNWTVTAPLLCAGVTGTWNATITDNNGLLSGTWNTSFGDQGTISGTAARVSFGSTTGVSFTGTITGNTISGTFIGDDCTGNGVRATGTFTGSKK